MESVHVSQQKKENHTSYLAMKILIQNNWLQIVWKFPDRKGHLMNRFRLAVFTTEL